MAIKPTVVLICGYARAGKDTLCEGLLQYEGTFKRALATSLKIAADRALDVLDVKGSFFDEQFKTENRELLVALGECARRQDEDVFVKNLAIYARCLIGGKTNCVIVPDWRYLNELRYLETALNPDYYRIVKVWISTAGVGPANPSEAESIQTILDNVQFDQSFFFKADCSSDVKQAGVVLGGVLGLGNWSKGRGDTTTQAE